MDSFRFYSWYWLLLFPVPILAIWLQTRPRNRQAVVFSSVADLRDLPVTVMHRVRRFLPLFQLAGFLLILAGLARPQSGRAESRISGDGIAVELVLDVSGSMEALDFQLDGQDVNRLQAVKHVLKQFVLGSPDSGLSGRTDDLIGLIAFGGFADSKCPLTLDHGALVSIMEGLEIPKPVRDRQGRVINADSLQEELATAIGDGLALGVDRLRGSRAMSKVIVLLTDGDSNAGVVEPLEAADIAKELGIRVYTVGIGQNGVVPFPQEDAFGQIHLQPAQFRIDEELLRKIAEITGGTYFHASDSAGLTKVYSQIDQLEKSQFEETKYSEYTELYPWFSGAGLLIVCWVHVLRETRLRSLP